MNMTRVSDPRAEAAEAPFQEPSVNEALAPRAVEAAACLKALAHEKRLLMLCHLAAGERSLTELGRLLSMRPSAVSQDLARLRLEGLVDRRRVGKAMHYRVADARVARLVETLRGIFGPAAPEAR